MNLRVPFIVAICCLIPLSACKKPAAREGSAASAESSEVDPKKTDEYKKRMEKGSRLLGGIQATRSTRGWYKHNIDVAQDRYDEAKAKLGAASSPASFERAKLNAEDARDALAKAKQTYDQAVEEAKAELAQAKEILKEDYEGDDALLMSDEPYTGP